MATSQQPPCTRRRYRTARYARRMAFSQEPDPTQRPVPQQCQDEGCGGAWHLVAANHKTA